MAWKVNLIKNTIIQSVRYKRYTNNDNCTVNNKYLITTKTVC